MRHSSIEGLGSVLSQSRQQSGVAHLIQVAAISAGLLVGSGQAIGGSNPRHLPKEPTFVTFDPNCGTSAYGRNNIPHEGKSGYYNVKVRRDLTSDSDPVTGEPTPLGNDTVMVEACKMKKPPTLMDPHILQPIR